MTAPWDAGDESRTDAVVAKLERYETLLRRIANSESGFWGREAHEALHPERGEARSRRRRAEYFDRLGHDGGDS